MEAGFVDRLLTGLLDVGEPIVHPSLDFIATRLRSPWPRWFYRALSELGWKQVASIFNRHLADDLLAAMDRNGISHTVVAAIEPFFITETIAEALAPHGDRFSLFCAIDPYHPDPAARLRQIMASCQVHGLKIHPTLTGLHPHDDRMFMLMEMAHRHHLPVEIHTGTFPFDTGAWDDSELLEPAIAAFPDVHTVLCHIGWDQYERVIALARRHDNVGVETSWQPPRVIRMAVDALGADRVYFGSDYPLLRQEYALAHVRRALTPAEFEKVASTNGMRLLKLAPVNPRD